MKEGAEDAKIFLEFVFLVGIIQDLVRLSLPTCQPDKALAISNSKKLCVLRALTPFPLRETIFSSLKQVSIQEIGVYVGKGLLRIALIGSRYADIIEPNWEYEFVICLKLVLDMINYIKTKR